MIKSRAWDWDAVTNESWRNVANDFLPIGLKWKESNSKNILDVGCGIGRNAIFLAENNFNVYAFDLSESGLSQLESQAKKLNLTMDIKKGDMLHFPYEDNFFDFLLAYHTIYHTDYEGLKKVISEIHRVVKQSGDIYITLNSKESDAWDLYSDKRIDEHTLVKIENSIIEIPHTYLDYDEVINLLSGFKILKIRHIVDYADRKYAHFFVLCKKL